MQVFNSAVEYGIWRDAEKYKGDSIAFDDGKIWAFPDAKVPENTTIGTLIMGPYDVTKGTQERIGLKEKGAHIHLMIPGIWEANKDKLKNFYNITIKEKIIGSPR